MKTNKCFTAVVLTALMATGIQAQNHSVTITTAKAKKVSRMIYGWHYEEIGNIGEGGLYAEMVRNRGFEEANLPGGLVIENGQYKDVPNPGHPNKRVYQIDPLVGWVTTPLSNSPIRITCTDRHPLNDQNPHSMAVNVISNDLGRAAIHNRGYNGMAFKQGVACRLSFYARTEDYEGTVAFRLSDEEGRAVSEAKSFTIGKGQWTKYECELVPTKNIAAGMLTIVPSQRGRFQLDMVSMFPSDTYDGGRSVFRADVLQNLIDYRPHFLRFPGGCIVHGVNEETMYHWKKTIGDIAQRPGQWCKWEPHYRTDGLGYHEFYELCEYMGCDAMYVTPTGMACTEWVHRDDQRHFFHKETDVNYYINDLLDAIEYAIGPVDSRWGAERAKNGHPEPFPLKYVEIGNEDFGPVYYEKYHQIYSAVKQRYPQLRFIANSPLGTEGEKERFMDEFIDRSEVEIYDEHYYKGIPWAVKNFHKYDVYKRRGIDIFIGELGIQSNGVGGPSGRYPGSILAEGIFKMGLERNGDMNPIMADRPLMRNWESIDRNDMQPLILNSSTVSARTFNYYLCKMLRDNPVDQVYDVANSEGEQTLFVTAGRDLQRKQMVVKIINLSEQPQAFELKTDKNFKNRQTEVLTLTATPDQRVTPLTPDAVSTVTTTTTVSKGDKITLPGNAFVIYRISL